MLLKQNKQIYEQEGSEFISNVYDFGEKIFTSSEGFFKAQQIFFIIKRRKIYNITNAQVAS